MSSASELSYRHKMHLSDGHILRCADDCMGNGVIICFLDNPIVLSEIAKHVREHVRKNRPVIA